MWSGNRLAKDGETRFEDFDAEIVHRILFCARLNDTGFVVVQLVVSITASANMSAYAARDFWDLPHNAEERSCLRAYRGFRIASALEL